MTEEGSTKSERMSNVDTAWFRMEELTNQMTITGVLTFSEPLGGEAFRDVLEERLLKFDRFRQRVRRGRSFESPRWEEDPSFDLGYHVKDVQLPAPGQKSQLQELASTLMSRPLDFSRPLWQFHVVEGYQEGAAVIARLHHCIADGVTLVRVLLSLTDATADAPPEGVPGEDMADALADVHRHQPDRGQSGKAPLTQRLVSTLKRAGRSGARLVRGLAHGAGVLGKLAWPASEPDTAFRGTLGRAKRAAWSEAVPLTEVKTVGRVLGGTVNDVLLTAMTGALRRYLQRREEVPDGLDLSAAVPVNLRPLDAPINMGNAFGLVFLKLPVGIADPARRLTVVRRRMDRLKCSPEAPILMKVLGAVGATTKAVEDQVVTYLARKVTAVATNVPGPQRKLYLAGAPLETLMAWVPQAGRVGLGISIISYDGEVRLGLATDETLIPDPEAVIDSFYQEFDAFRTRIPDLSSPSPEGATGDAPVKTSIEGAPAAAEGAEVDSTNSSSSVDDPERCQATTKAGTQCKLPAREGARFCHVHG